MAALKDSTESLGTMLQHLEWRSLEDRRRDARLVMMYKISHDKVSVTVTDFHTPFPPETLQKHARLCQGNCIAKKTQKNEYKLKICTKPGVNLKIR
jgi:ribonuclease PH